MLGMVHRQKQRKKSCSDIRRTMRGFIRMRDAEREEGICNLIKMQFCTNEQKANNTDRSQQCWSLLSRCTITALVLLRAWSQGPHTKDDITWTTFLCRSKKGIWGECGQEHQPAMNHLVRILWLQTLYSGNLINLKHQHYELTHFTTNSCLPTLRTFPCLLYFNWGLYNALII